MNQDRDRYGLNDAETLSLAASMAPELFAALAIAHQVKVEEYPISTTEQLVDAVFPSGGEDLAFKSPGVSFARGDVGAFPAILFPVESTGDLVKKAYIAIFNAHRTLSVQRLNDARDRGEVGAVHPFPEMVI